MMRQDRFTEQAQAVLQASQEMVRQQKHTQWDVEHVLLALVQTKDGLAKLEPNSAFRAIVSDGLKAAEHHDGKLTDQIDLHEWVTMSLQRSVNAIDSDLQTGLAGYPVAMALDEIFKSVSGVQVRIDLLFPDAGNDHRIRDACRVIAALTSRPRGLSRIAVVIHRQLIGQFRALSHHFARCARPAPHHLPDACGLGSNQIGHSSCGSEFTRPHDGD